MAGYSTVIGASGPELPESPDVGGSPFALFYLTAEFNGNLPGVFLHIEGAWQRIGLALPTVLALLAAPVTWTNMPSATTEFGASQYRTRVDLSKAQKIRLVASMQVAGVSGSQLWLQYSTNQSTWVDLMANRLPVSTTGVNESAWEDVPAGALADVFIRVMGSGGNGTLDPQFRRIELQAR
jgi:hypothetical protein